MSHNQKRTVWYKEGLFGLATGVLYGSTSVAVGHPFDTIKTKMQAQTQYMGKQSMTSTFVNVFKKEGIRGWYRGWWPPLWGSAIFRSSQFAVYEALYTKWNSGLMLRDIPGTPGTQVRVIAAGFSAALVRSLIECPTEYAKVLRQTNQAWTLRKVYTGFGLQLARTSGVMVWYFACVDYVRRRHPNAFDTMLGQFCVSAGAATTGFWVVWPVEVLKNQVQAGTKAGDGQTANILQRVKFIWNTQGGIFGLYRGILPGTLRSVFSNGFSMIVMQWAQRQTVKLGLRD